MSTRARIGYLEHDGTVTSIYVHYDGYLEHVGETLCEHYNGDDAARALVGSGDMAVLGVTLGECEHYGDSPSRRHALDKWPETDQQYTYLRRDGRWFYSRNERDFSPVKDDVPVDELAQLRAERDALRARVSEQEAPPVVPEGWRIEKRDEPGGSWTWGAIDESGDNAIYQVPTKVYVRSRGFVPLTVLNAFVWAIKHDQPPPHAGDAAGGES